MRDPALRELARVHGIQPAFEDWRGRRRVASADAVRGALAALGRPVESASEASKLAVAAAEERSSRLLEPVLVAWDGRLASIPLRLTGADGRGAVEMTLGLEDGSTRSWPGRPEMVTGDGLREIPGPGRVPLGRHRLEVSAGGREGAAWVIAAPRRAPDPGRSWGVFAPIHGLRSAGTWGAGDFDDLAALGRWVSERGGEVVGTLPPLAAFLNDPFEPSPYTPVSRLFWNELFVRPDGAPLKREGRGPGENDGRLVDYRAAMRAKAPALEEMAARLPDDELRAFVDRRPEVERYARFRAAVERLGGWGGWPRELREGRIPADAADPDVIRRVIAVQAIADRQIAEAAGRATLLLDLPLGAHPEGYDTWAHREAFAMGISAGAPPDDLAAAGQDWGFPPLHPHTTREDGHAYFSACVRHLLSRAGALRIDHVMGLHRLYWIPDGLAPTDGVYVRYPRDELYAVLCLEAHRTGATLVGEDLGTVPREVRTTMARRGVLRTYVAQTELTEDELRPVPERAQATVNTHDMPTFASFWAAGDIDLRVRLGLLEEAEAEDERKRRERQREALVSALSEEGWLEARSAEAVLLALLRRLAASDARIVIASLDDLVGETDPLNVPGTTDEYPNWRRVVARTLEELAGDAGVDELLRAIDEARRETA